tara:strand:- start:33 stop:638 length:606 start_codon:yes stop_codon:yes gene_type:complete
MNDLYIRDNIMKTWLNKRFEIYQNLIMNDDLNFLIIQMRNMVIETRERDGKMIFAGNGASNTIATHASLDFMNQLGIPCLPLNDSGVITAFSNDFGYDSCVERFTKLHANENDMLVLISSSGMSENIVRAAKYANDIGCGVVTFTGFSSNNHLKTLGDVNFWVDSNEYNIVENIHMMWLISVCDLIAFEEKETIGTHGRNL